MAKTEEILGFANPENFEDEENDSVNYKKKGAKKSGGFQAMGLSHPVLNGILRRGYKIPTPIQRKTIPLALDGRDVVAMARTGSGKTACFLIPLFEKLKARQAKTGARALVLSPTRELALQTLKFIKEIGKFTGLKAAVVLGGDSMDNQFSAIHGSPDIIVATPGRFLHVCVEMDLNLNSICYVVFDEADRLFEMGFGEQIHEIANRLPQNRQTLLFSATLPKVLVEFAKAGLGDPILLRLDVESKLPDELTLSFITCRPEEKLAVLLCLLKNIIKPESQTVIFAATMHHVDYIHQLLDKANIANTFIYSNLDPTARKINAAKFQNGSVKVLVVTDVAARGLDIPHLDCVINYNFPEKSKVFVHRVGRCARAGRTGTAYNIICPDEYAYLLDLHLFLGRSFHVIPPSGSGDIPEGAIGKIPPSMVEEELAELISWHENTADLQSTEQVCNNAYQQYLRSRPAASTESCKRVKNLNIGDAGIIPEFCDIKSQETQNSNSDILARMKNYRPPGTVFEICSRNTATDYKVMKNKRAFHKDSIRDFHRKKEEREENAMKCVEKPASKLTLASSSADEIKAAFNEVIIPKKRKMDDLYKPSKKKKQKTTRDDEFYIPYTAPDKHTEDGLAVNAFAKDAEKLQVDLMADSEETRRLQTQVKKWDRKKKKMVTINNMSKVGKIRSESGAWIPASYKTNRYSQWQEKNKVDSLNDRYDDEEESPMARKLKTGANTHWARHNQKMKDKVTGKSELKKPEEILKARIIREKRENRGRKKKGKSRGQKGRGGGQRGGGGGGQRGGGGGGQRGGGGGGRRGGRR